MWYKKIKKYYSVFIWIFLITLFLLRYAEPIKDGDIFFHIKYGEFHIENQTMLADHSLFSWTPATAYVPYCTWAADVILYLLYQAGGWPLLNIFKYLCLFSPIFMIWLFARKLRLETFPLTFFINFVVLFAIVDAAFIKPEIMSLFFFVLVASLYFFIKTDPSDEKKAYYFLLYPIIILCWVNMHGVFIFGMILLAAIISGEFINYLFQTKFSFPKKTMVIITVSGIASAAATLLTPYGLDYHAHLLKQITQGMSSQVADFIVAYRSILDDIEQDAMQHNLEHFGIMAILFVVTYTMNAIKNRDWDFGILLPTVFLFVIGLKYQRSTFYWPCFWAMSILYLSSKNRLDLSNQIKTIRPAIKYSIVVLLALLFIYIPARTLHEVYLRPTRWLYHGFGFSQIIPVQEAAFLKENKIGTKLFNSYNTGNYIIFDQYPERKVFIDTRYFPYEDFTFDRYSKFQMGQTSLSDFESEFGFDIALIDHSTSVSKKFITSDKWRAVYYGIAGVVFLRDDIQFQNNISSLDINRFNGLKNIVQAADIVVMAQNLEDYHVASNIIELMKNKLSHMADFDFFYRYCTAAQNGIEAYERGDIQDAFRHLWGIAGLNYNNLRVIKAVKDIVGIKLEVYIGDEEYAKARRLMNRTLRHYPDDPNLIYNAGVVNYMAMKRGNGENSNEDEEFWRVLLSKLVISAPDYPHIDIVRKLLLDQEITEQIPLAKM